jgi:hypothetical protein
MTNNTRHLDGTETCPDDHQRAVEACQHAADVLHDGNFSHAHTLLDEARAAVKRAQHDVEQASRESAYDCYD